MGHKVILISCEMIIEKDLVIQMLVVFGCLGHQRGYLRVLQLFVFPNQVFDRLHLSLRHVRQMLFWHRLDVGDLLHH